MSTRILRRYTSLASALDILETKTLTLLSPSTWDDEVDRSLMIAYQRRKNLKSILALCFAAKGETYHHWRIFTDGSSGACVTFERERLEQAAKQEGVLIKAITYKTIANNRDKPVTTEGLPFTKRAAFKDEGEVRMVFTSSEEELRTKRIEYPAGAMSLSGILCARHSMTTRSMYAYQQEDDEGGDGRGGADADHSQGAH
jgi:hypothetical protein